MSPSKGSFFAMFILLLFSVLCGVIFKSVLKSILGIVSAAGSRKKHKHGSTVRVKIITGLPAAQPVIKQARFFLLAQIALWRVQCLCRI